MIKSTLGSLFSLYIGGMYYFSLVNFPIAFRNRHNLRTNNPWSTLVKQALLWPIVMPRIMQHGNPALELIRDEDE
jgi:hypothetical protein